jgi:hypothetical protein
MTVTVMSRLLTNLNVMHHGAYVAQSLFNPIECEYQKRCYLLGG